MPIPLRVHAALRLFKRGWHFLTPPLAPVLAGAYLWDVNNHWGVIKVIRSWPAGPVIPWPLMRTVLWTSLLFLAVAGINTYRRRRWGDRSRLPARDAHVYCFSPFLWIIPAFAIQYGVGDLSFVKWLYYFPRLVLIVVFTWAGIRFFQGYPGPEPGLNRPDETVAERASMRWIVWSGIGLFSVGFAVLLMGRFVTVCEGRELGVFTQAFWNTLHGRFMAHTRAAFTGSMSAVILDYHISPLLPLLTPVYALWQDPRSLLAAQALLTGLGAWPLFLLTRSVTGNPFAGAAVAWAYFCFAPLQYALTFDLRTVTFVPPLVFWGAWALYERRYKQYGMALALLLACREDTFLYALGLGMFARVYGMPKRVVWITAGAGLAWGAFVIGWVAHCVQTGACDSPYLLRYGRFLYLGDTPGAVFQTLALHPDVWLEQMGSLLHRRALVALLLPLGFLSVFGGRSLILLLLPGLAWAFSDDFYIYHFENHYFAFLTPGLFIAAVFGIERISRRASGWERMGWTKWGVQRRAAVLALVSSAVTGAIDDYRAVFPWPGKLAASIQAAYAPAAHEQARIRLARLVPADAPVSSNRPACFAQRQWNLYFPVLGNAEYVFIDLMAGVHEMPDAAFKAEVERVRSDPRYRLIAQEEGILVFMRQRSADRRDFR